MFRVPARLECDTCGRQTHCLVPVGATGNVEWREDLWRDLSSGHKMAPLRVTDGISEEPWIAVADIASSDWYGGNAMKLFCHRACFQEWARIEEVQLP